MPGMGAPPGPSPGPASAMGLRGVREFVGRMPSHSGINYMCTGRCYVEVVLNMTYACCALHSRLCLMCSRDELPQSTLA